MCVAARVLVWANISISAKRIEVEKPKKFGYSFFPNIVGIEFLFFEVQS